MSRRALIPVVIALATISVGQAEACPVCAAGQSRSGWAETALVIAMIAVPMVLAGVAFVAIRSAMRARAGEEPR